MLENEIIEIISNTKPKGNTYYVLLGAFFPVAMRLRPAGEYRIDEFDRNTDGTVSLEERRIGDKLDLEIIPWKVTNQQLPPQHNHYFVIRENDSRIKERIKNLEEMNIQDIEVGRILGYPEHCIQACMEDYSMGTPADIRGTEQINYFKSKGREINPLTYYTWGFIPCKPNCEEALETGNKIHSAYERVHPEIAKLYEQMCKDWMRIMGLVAEEFLKNPEKYIK